MESMKEIIHNKKWGKFNCFGIYAWLILGITSCYHKVQEEKNSVNKEIVQQQEKIRSFFPFPEIRFFRSSYKYTPERFSRPADCNLP